MTLREEFEKEVKLLTHISTEELLLSGNKQYIEWLENKYQSKEVSLDDLSEWEIVDYLKNDYFDFISEVDEDDMIDYLQNRGYIISERNTPEYETGLDLIDNNRLEEIKNLFIYSSFAEREEIYKKVIEL
jgi:hypothetical protein